jgi:hypothetical protein
VKRLRDHASTIISPLIFLLVASARVGAAQDVTPPPAVEEAAPPAQGELLPAQPAEADPAEGYPVQLEEHSLDGDLVVVPEEEREVHDLEQKGGWLGFRTVESDGYGGRALEYGLLRSSRSAGLFYRNLKKGNSLELEGEFLNSEEYQADLLVDFGGDYRLHLRTESMYHNLDRELLFTSPFRSFRSDPPAPGELPLADYLPSQGDAGEHYGISVVQDLAHFRYRLHDYPLHVNLGYWRFLRQGTMQQRFADHSFEGGPNTFYAVPREIDQQVHEGHLGVDAHLGPVDVVYVFRGRIFDERGPTPVANFVPRDDINGNPERVGGPHQHNENPDARFLSHTLKLHTSLTGGIVGSGSYSIDQRENRSKLSDTTGFSGSQATVQNAALDFTYTPSKEYSLALKYRRHELDHDVHGTISSNNFVDPVQQLRPPVDRTKDIISATLAYRPRNDLSMTGEYRGQFLKRNHVSLLPSESSWALPEHSETHSGSLALLYRPVKGLRTGAEYSYSNTDNPSYGASYEQRHEGKLLASYARSNVWGATGNLVIRREWNHEVQRYLVNYPLEPLEYTRYPQTSRDRHTENFNVGVWVAPTTRVTLGANYAHLRSSIDQPVLFTGVAVGSEAASTFTSHSHVYGVNGSYAVNEALNLSLMLQQAWARSTFRPDYVAFSATSDTSGISELSRQRSVISSLSARGEYRFSQAVSTTLDYSVRDYDEDNPYYSWGNGTVHVILAGVAGKWD